MEDWRMVETISSHWLAPTVCAVLNFLKFNRKRRCWVQFLWVT